MSSERALHPAPRPESIAAPRRGVLIGLALLLVAWTALVYARIVDNGFVEYDTGVYLTHNPRVLDGLSARGFTWGLTAFHAANWHPLTWWSFMLDVELFGLRPAAHHLVNVAFHAANGVLLFLLVVAWTRRTAVGFFVAATFLVHPLHVESVAWVVERKDVLSTFFGFLALAAWTRHVRSGSRLAFAGTVLCHALSLMAKPMWVTLPLLLLVLDVWPLARADAAGTRRAAWSDRVREKWPFFVLSALGALLTWRAQSDGGAVQGLEHLSLLERTLNALAGLAWYVVRTFWPSGLSFYYPLGGEARDGWRILGAIFVLVSGAWAWIRRREAPWVAACLAWFVVLLLPVSGLVQVGGQAHADRYTYVSVMGLVLLVAWSLDRIARSAVVRRGVALAAVACLVVFSAIARERVTDWKDSETLARAALEVDDSSALAHNLLGWKLVEKDQVDEGLKHLSRAVALSPGDPEARRNLGRALVRSGQIMDGENELRAAAAIRPNDPRILAELGAACMIQGRFDEARATFGRALEIDPPNVDARTGLGELLERTGDLVGAERELRAALAIEPGSVRALVDLARVLIDTGRAEEAASALARVLAVDPRHPQALQQDARVRVARGDHVGAVRSLRAAIAARPQWPLALADLAWILACAPDPAARDATDALKFATDAVALGNYQNAAYLDVLAAALAANARFEEAATLARRAADAARARGEEALATRIEKRHLAYSAGIMDIGTPR